MERRLRGMELKDRQDFVSCPFPKFSPWFPGAAVSHIPRTRVTPRSLRGGQSGTSRWRWDQAPHCLRLFSTTAFHMQIARDAIIQLNASTSCVSLCCCPGDIWGALGRPWLSEDSREQFHVKTKGKCYSAAAQLRADSQSWSWAPWIRTFLLASFPFPSCQYVANINSAFCGKLS